MNATSSRLWLAIRFSDLALTALTAKAADDRPTIVVQKKQVIFTNPLATEAGVQQAMDATTAQLLSSCVVLERDEAKEQAALHQLSELLYQISPYIEDYNSKAFAQSGLLLEISSCLALFGGVKPLAEKTFSLLDQTPYGFQYGLAHSAAAAWYLSFVNHAISGGETRSMFIERLNALPTDLLADYPKALESLDKTGFRYFADLARQMQGKSSASFRKRLGSDFTDLLDDIYGNDRNIFQAALFEKPRDNYRPDEWFEETIEFEYPVTIVEQLKPAIENLLQQLCEYLRKRQQQCQYIEWRIADIYRQQITIAVKSDLPQTGWQLLYDLSLIQFDARELPFEVDTIGLCCQQTTPLQSRSQNLDFEQNQRVAFSATDFTITIAKLKARLGESKVYKLSYKDSRVPEQTNTYLPLAEKSQQLLPAIYQQSIRPAWILTAPELAEERQGRLFWKGYFSITLGPERIIGNWWESAVARDYYLATRQDNVRLWVYFDLYEKRWYVHGVFS